MKRFRISSQKSRLKSQNSRPLVFLLSLLAFLIVGAVRAEDTLRLDTMNVTAPRTYVTKVYAHPTTNLTVPQTQQQYNGKYILASLALPGAGEMWMKNRLKGEIFLWTDAAVWLTWGTMTTIGNSRDHSAKLFASQYSGSSIAQRTDDYYVALERYPTSDMYNEDIRREARELYPDNPERQHSYADSRSYTGDKAWSWGSDSLRFNYWRQRKGARGVLHAAGFVIGAALVDRLVSAIDVAFFTPLPEAGAALQRDSRLAAAPTVDRPGLTVFYRF